MVDCGRYPVKRVMGEPCVVEADIFRDGDHVLHAVIKWRSGGETQFSESPMVHVDNDRWRGEFPLERNDRYRFHDRGVDRSLRFVGARLQEKGRSRARRRL